MSDTDTQTDAPAEVENPTGDADDTAQEADRDDDSDDWRSNFDADKAAERIRKLQSEAKNLRARAKDAETKAAGVDERDKRIQSLESDLLRERVGRRLNLPDELVDRLRGGTEDELLADAEKLVGLIGARPASRKPAEQLRGGLDPEREPEEDPKEAVRRIRARGY